MRQRENRSWRAARGCLASAARYLYVLLAMLWECRVPLIVVFLYGAVLFAGQTAEFLDQFLLLCGSVGAACGQSGGIRATAFQFITFCALGFMLGCFVQMTSRAALASAANLQRHQLAMVWIPVMIGMVPVVLTSYALLLNLGYTNGSGNAAIALFWATLLVGIPGIVRAVLGRRDYVLATTAAIFVVVLCTLDFDTRAGDWLLGVWALTIVLLSLGSVRRLAVRFGWRSPASWLLALPVGGAVFAVMGSMLPLAAAAGHAPIWTMTWTILAPGCFLHCRTAARAIFQYGRRRFAPGAQRSCHRLRTAIRSSAPSLRPDTLILTGVSLAVFCATLWWMGVDPNGASESVIAPSAMTVVLTTLLLGWSLLTWLVSRMLRWFLVMSVLAVSACTGIPGAPLALGQVDIADGHCGDGGTSCGMDERIWARYLEWNGHHGKDDEAPVVLVAAAGGGSRAAAHTVATLAAVDEITCGAFGDRIFAISGVSGGAVGSALYAAARRDLGHRLDRTACVREPALERGRQRISGLIAATTADHLSAIVNRAVTRDALTALASAPPRADMAGLDYASRGGLLTETWQLAYDDFLRRQGIPAQGGNSLTDSRLSDDPSQPLMIFNATSVQDGQRVILSRPLICPPDAWCAEPGGMLRNATTSARFPLVSPALASMVYRWDPVRRQATVSERAIVDGGYFDNSGVTALLDVIRVLKRHGIPSSRIVAILISSNPDEGKPMASVTDFAHGGWLAQMLTPIQTITAVREGRSAAALHQLNEELGRCDVLYWQMSTETPNPLSAEVQRQRRAQPEVDASRRLYGRPSEIESLRRAPALGWALSHRSAAEMQGVAYRHALPYANGSFAYDNDLRLAARLSYLAERTASDITKALAGSECGGKRGYGGVHE